MVVLCSMWRRAQDVYDLLCEIVHPHNTVQPLLMYGASGDGDVEVRSSKLKLKRKQLKLKLKYSCAAI